MTAEQDDFAEIRSAFLEEAEQLLSQAEQGFLNLENRPDDSSILDLLFRLAHNLKGSGAAVGFTELSSFTHRLESLLLKLKEKVIQVTPPVVDLLLRCNDQLKGFLSALKTDHNAHVDATALIQDIDAAMSGGLRSAPPPPSSPPVSEGANGNSTHVIESGAAPSEQAPPAVDHSPSPRVETPPLEVSVDRGEPPPSARKAPPPADENVRVAASKIDLLLNFVGEMVILQSVLQEQVNRLGRVDKQTGAASKAATRKESAKALLQFEDPLGAGGKNSSDSSDSTESGKGLKEGGPLGVGEASALGATARQMEKITKEIQSLSMSMRMVPMKPLFQKLQRIVRDTAKALDKSIKLEISGDETELDRTVLEQLGDPLVHMVRNAVDHGVEDKSDRLMAGKSEEGHVLIRAYHKVGQIVIEVGDDGKGLDPERLVQSAIKKGILPPGKTLPEQEAFQLIFAPGFSTKDAVTSISGRGVGMDVVRTNIEALKGNVQIESTIGKGTRFQIALPLTLAIIDAMVVRVGEERFVVPLHHVFETFNTGDVPTQRMPDGQVAVLLRNENLPSYELRKLLGRPSGGATTLSFNGATGGASGSERSAAGAATSVPDRVNLVIRTQQFVGAVEVDEIISQQQAVIKPLGPELGRVRGVKGSAILGDGRPALILEIPALLATPQNKRVA